MGWRIRWIAVLGGGVALALCCVAAPAAASTASVSAGALVYLAAPGEANVVVVSLRPASPEPVHRIIDSGANITPAAGCTAVSSNTVDCSGATSITVNAGDMPDSVTIDAAAGSTLNGGDEADALIGGSGADSLNGQAGEDLLDGRGGADRMSGGADVDTVTYASRVDDATVDLDNVADDGEAGENDDVRSDVQNVIGGAGSDTFVGSIGTNLLSGGSGDDSLDGGLGSDTLVGGPGTDTVSYEARAIAVTVDIDGEPDDGQIAESDNVQVDVENVIGGSEADRLTGSSTSNTLTGGAGNDVITGAEGPDALLGGPGADALLSRDAETDTVVCGTEVDSAVADAVDDVNADCDLIDRDTNGNGSGDPPASQPQNDAPETDEEEAGRLAPLLVVSGRVATMTARGVIRVRVTCQPGPCSANVTVKTLRKVKAPGRRARALTLGRRSVSLPGSAATNVKVKVSQRIRRLLIASRVSHVRVIVFLTNTRTRDSQTRPLRFLKSRAG